MDSAEQAWLDNSFFLRGFRIRKSDQFLNSTPVQICTFSEQSTDESCDHKSTSRWYLKTDFYILQIMNHQGRIQEIAIESCFLPIWLQVLFGATHSCVKSGQKIVNAELQLFQYLSAEHPLTVILLQTKWNPVKTYRCLLFIPFYYEQHLWVVNKIYMIC